MTTKEPGYVYILTNPSFREDWVKIGMSSRPVEQRLKELDTTGIPLPFEIFATMKTSKYKEAEKHIHHSIERFTKLRIRDNREFFNVKPEVALEIFREVADLIDDAVIEENFKNTAGEECQAKNCEPVSRQTAQRTEPVIWLTPSNSKFFDIHGYMAKYDEIFWDQYYNFLPGDTIYIYSSSPDSAIKYKFSVVSTELNYSDEMTKEHAFYVDPTDIENSKKHNRYAKLKLIDKINSDRLTLAHLMEHGLGMAPRGAMYLHGDLLKYIEESI